ncbi:hypothetical protein [Ideonella sp. BN130291]|uniref:hypothetical protein n=1 Tax=Ideonella sp. BN130291 TaxID=3112940 RepID=UPI002E25B685|nr:hypothetical protein [Ideonella sp. BN130291]
MTRVSPSSHFANADAARTALQMALPMIEPQMTQPEVVGSGFLYIVVMDPALRPGDVPFEEAILLEHAVGDRAKWDADYAAFARAKAKASWEQGMDGHRLQALQPYKLREGDSMLWGAVCLDGIVVGVSGAHAYYDEAFATAIAGCLRAVAKHRWQQAVDARQLFAGGSAPGR